MRSSSDIAEELAGKRVLTIVSNPDTGFSLLQLGTWRRRPQSIPNPNLTDQQRNYQGTDSIFVQCPWELSSPGDLRDNESIAFRPGERLKLLDVLIGAAITTAAFEGGDLQLHLLFDNEMSLTLKPNQGSQDQNYSIGLAGGTYWTVYESGRVEEQQL